MFVRLKEFLHVLKKKKLYYVHSEKKIKWTIVYIYNYKLWMEKSTVQLAMILYFIII